MIFKLKSLFLLGLPLTVASHAMNLKNTTDNDIQDTIIIGGGMAGLTAAYELTKNNIPVTLFEGRDRLGGRTNTHYFNENKDVFYEEGGTFIDDDHCEAIKLAETLGVKLIKRGYGTRDVSIIYQGNSKNESELLQILISTESELEKIIQNLNSELHHKSLDTLIKESAISDEGKAFLISYCEDEKGILFKDAPINTVFMLNNSIKEFIQLLRMKDAGVSKEFIDSIAYDYTVKCGMSHFVDSLKKSIENHVPIHLERKLVSLNYENALYVLEFQNSDHEIEKITARKVIMTLPFSTLRDVKIMDSVKFPENTLHAINTLSYGTNSKIGISLTGCTNLYDKLVYHMDLDDHIVGWPGEKAMTLLIAADKGKNLEEDNATEISKKQMDFIKKKFECSSDTIAYKNWTQDEFSKGSYSTWSINNNIDLTYSNDREIRNFALPINKKTFIFAGEHTRADGTSGYIEGAIRSGKKAAKYILERKETL